MLTTDAYIAPLVVEDVVISRRQDQWRADPRWDRAFPNGGSLARGFERVADQRKLAEVSQPKGHGDRKHVLWAAYTETEN